jgi:1,4-dihydroxy-2-naphthoyl-CoA synthase
MISFELVRACDGINLYRCGAAAKLELNRPERLNALDDQLSRQLLALLQQAAADPSVRSVLITGDRRLSPHPPDHSRHAQASHQCGERSGGGHRQRPGAQR